MAQNGFLTMLMKKLMKTKKDYFLKKYIFQEWCPSHAGGAPGLFHHGATPQRSTQVNIRTDCLELKRWQPQSISLSSSPFSLQLVLMGRVNSTHLNTWWWSLHRLSKRSSMDLRLSKRALTDKLVELDNLPESCLLEYESPLFENLEKRESMLRLSKRDLLRLSKRDLLRLSKRDFLRLTKKSEERKSHLLVTLFILGILLRTHQIETYASPNVLNGLR